VGFSRGITHLKNARLFYPGQAVLRLDKDATDNKM
jgi:hypothetical protein